MFHVRRIPLAVAMAVLLSMGTVIAAQSPSSLAEGVYTADQADRGAVLYEEQCLSCHGELSAFVPELAALLADHTFRNRWRGRSLGELFELIQVEMPQDAPGTLSFTETAELVAYILQGNRIPTGETPLADNLEQLSQIPFEP